MKVQTIKMAVLNAQLRNAKNKSQPAPTQTQTKRKK